MGSNQEWLPRIYPQGFADCLRKLYPGLVTGAEGVPPLDSNSSPTKLFEGMHFSTWEEAKLVHVVRYLRGNKHLDAPKEWSDVFPAPLEALYRLEMQRQASRASSSA